MRGMLTRLIVLMIIAAGCSTSGTPATVPPSIPETTTVATTTVPPTTSTRPTTTTTTLDRRSEIEAIFQDLEERRLQALYEGDREAFKALFANDEYMKRSMGAFDAVEFLDGWTAADVFVAEVIHDGQNCIAVRTSTDYSDVFQGGSNTPEVEVIERMTGGWGLSYAGEGWECEGPHPFSR